MYVGLFVRDECERSVKNQTSKVESVDFATSSREATHENAICGAHDWKMKSCARLSIFRLSRKNGQLAKDPRKFLFGKKLWLHYQFFTYTIYTLITHEL